METVRMDKLVLNEIAYDTKNKKTLEKSRAY